LISHFAIGDAEEIHTFREIYEYIEKFEKRNEELQATSAKYWCERRYFEHKWDADLGVPSRTCQSPRLHALTVGEEESQISWNDWYRSVHGESHPSDRGSAGSSSSTDSSSAGSSSSTHSSSSSGRLLQEEVQVIDEPEYGQLGLVNLTKVRRAQAAIFDSAPACVNQDMILAIEEGKNTTCAEEAFHVCKTDTGMHLCSKECGYCSPFQYDRVHQFPKPQVTLLPIVVYQTMFASAPCHGYAATYLEQKVNPLLFILPALDGPRSDAIITCIDRSKPYTGDYAVEMECGDGYSPYYCKPCTLKGKESKMCLRDTKRVDFHGLSVYPKMILQPHRDILRMAKLDWLNINTDEVSLSTVIYTEGQEIFTSVTLTFKVDEAGNVHESHQLVSYRDLTEDSKAIFIVCLIICCAMAFIGVSLSVIAMIKNPESCKWGLQAFELLSRSLLFAYPIVLLVSWSQQVPMSKEYDYLLRAILDMPELTETSANAALSQYFEVKTHIYKEIRWLREHRISANLVLYLQFWQLMLYLSAHPRMAMLTDTVFKACWNILHFLCLFMVLFCMMAFMAHWQLGEFIRDFTTYGAAISTQARMIYGEFIYVDGAGNLEGTMLFMYWLYAFTFLLVMYFILLNFFLAIVVDAFADVNALHEDSVYINNFFLDCLDTFRVEWYKVRCNWPSHRNLIKYLRDVENSQLPPNHWLHKLELDKHLEHDPMIGKKVLHVFPEDLKTNFPKNFGDDAKLAFYLCHYYAKMPKVLRRRQAKGKKSADDVKVDLQFKDDAHAAAEALLLEDEGSVHQKLVKVAALNVHLVNQHKEMRQRLDELAGNQRLQYLI